MPVSFSCCWSLRPFGMAGLVILTGYVACACGGAAAHAPASAEPSGQRADEPGPRPSAEPTASACSRKNRQGTYNVQFLAVSSTCPDPQPFEEQLTGDAPALGPGCKHDMPDRWSEDGCTLERAYTCEQDGGGTSRTVVSSKQKTSNGSVLTGMMSLRMIDQDGSTTCQGTYSVLAERQE
jgi:hypothetical protein